jgi:uncharacterized protein (DUF1501 family)
MKRGRFLLSAASGITVVANFDHVMGRALADAPLSRVRGGDDRVLLLIDLQGGNDGLNCVVPHGNPLYYRARPTLGIRQSDVLQIDQNVGFNPQMRSLKTMYDKGMVAVVQSVGYPDPDHSHFRSSEIWQTAAPEKYDHTGWLGRYLDEAQLPEENLFNAVAVSQVLPEALVSTTVDVPTVARIGGYGLVSDRNANAKRTYTELVNDHQFSFRSPYLGHVAEIEDHAQRGSEELPKLVAGYKTNAVYPATPLGRSLALAAQIVGSKIGTRVLYVQHGSFDTHISQQATQDRLLAELSDSVAAFYDDLAEHGNDKRVLTLTFSEFGRRIAENGSRGTDHGEASPLFMIGGGIEGGLYGDGPDLSSANMGNVRFTTDFRTVYATVLERWLGRPSAKILGGAFGTLPVIA